MYLSDIFPELFTRILDEDNQPQQTAGLPEIIADLSNVLESIQTGKPTAAAACPKNLQEMPRPKVSGFYCPDIQRVTFNGDTTIVFFVDGTYAVLKRSSEDKYDRKTAVVYAIVKRMLGKLGKTDKNGKFHANEVDGAGFGIKLQNIVDNGFDQELEEKTALEKKRAAHAAHKARQEAEKNAAFEKRVEARAKEILLERAAIDRANKIEDDNRACNTDSNCGCEKNCSKKCENTDSKKSGDWQSYVKPDKPFSQFTEEEKHAYWRYHNAKRRNKSYKA